MTAHRLVDLLPHLILPTFFLALLAYGHLSGLPRDVAASLLLVLGPTAPAYCFWRASETSSPFGFERWLYVVWGCVGLMVVFAAILCAGLKAVLR